MRNSKYLLFFLGMASLTFTGCSTSDNFADAAPEETPQLTEDEKWVLEANSDVEIKLGTGGNQAFTRAFVGDGDDETSTLFTTTEGIGMFCLAAAKKQSDASTPDINWAQYNTNNEGRYMNWMGTGTSTNGDINTITWGGNVKANAKPIERVTRIVWEDGFTRFYPMGNWYNYTFYGYHPYQESVTTEKDSVTVDIPIDGYTDVLWGRSYKPEAGSGPGPEEIQDTGSQYAYSGKYFREYRKKHPGSEAPVPTMKFKHVLSRINFMVAKGDTIDGNHLYVKELKLMGVVRKKVTLKVADLSTADSLTETAAGFVTVTNGADTLKTSIAKGLDRNGKLEYDEGQYGVELPYSVTYNAGVNDTIPLCDESKESPKRPNGVELLHKKLGEDALEYTRLGTGIMVPPTNADPHYQLQLTIVLKRPENNGAGGTVEKTYTFVPQFPYDINFPGGRLEPGKQYNVHLTIYTPQDIVVNAELEDWKDVEMKNEEDGGIEI